MASDIVTLADAPKPRTRRGRGGITLADVAKLAGVAPITASRALNTPDLVSPGILVRVREAVERTGYVPNILAGGLASNKSRLIAAVVPTVSSVVFLPTVQALTTALREGGYQLMLGQTGYSESSENELLEQVIGRRPDGIVLMGILHSKIGRKRLSAAGIPIVETWDLTPTPIDMLVGFSHEKVGVAVATYLYRKYGTGAAVLCADDARAARREDGFLEAAKQLGLTGADGQAIPTVRVPAPSSAHSGRVALSTLLTSAPNTRCIFCGSDLMALGVLSEAATRGLRVPEDIAVVGFGDLPFAVDLYPSLTTVRIDGEAIGRQAAQFILARAGDSEEGPKVVDIGFTLVERATA